jgi:YrbI family 3-deoxy-D-manno-octulosonate 8-phosphate phosphatase
MMIEYGEDRHLLSDKMWDRLAKIDTVLFDFDGVMTDNRVSVNSFGSGEIAFVNRSDGLGVSRLLAAGLYVAIITSERGGPAYKRAAKLRITCYDAHVFGGKDKTITENNLDGDNVLFVGNDINDLPVIPHVGVFVAVQDAFEQVKRVADIVLVNKGGYGAVREICDMILEAKGENWQ